MSLSFDKLLEGRPETIKQTAMQLKGLALKADKHVQERIFGTKTHVAVYTVGKTEMFALQLTDKFCALYLHHTDKANTMGLKLEGEKEPRHVKITTITPEFEKELKEVMKSVVKAGKN